MRAGFCMSLLTLYLPLHQQGFMQLHFGMYTGQRIINIAALRELSDTVRADSMDALLAIPTCARPSMTDR